MKGFALRGLITAAALGPVLLGCAHMLAQAPPPTPAGAPGTAPAQPAASESSAVDQSLDITDSERRAFALGEALAQASFSYQPVVQQAALLAYSSNRDQEVGELAKLAPDAALARGSARLGIDQALALMQQLNAPPAPVAPIARLAARLDKPIALTGDSLTLASFNLAAADVLASLNEAEDLSSLLDTPVLQHWLKDSVSGRSGPVWYADGIFAGIARIAANDDLPELLPRVADVATDLRGIRDWLATRLPETPTVEQDALRDKIDEWLQQAPVLAADLGRSRSRLLPTDQLQAIGQISTMLEQLILGLPGASVSAAAIPPSPSPSAPIGTAGGVGVK
jgi:hypothetical protein